MDSAECERASPVCIKPELTLDDDGRAANIDMDHAYEESGDTQSPEDNLLNNVICSIEEESEEIDISSLGPQLQIPCRVTDETRQDREYECPDCRKSFTLRSNYVKHRRVHLVTDREWVCKICDKGFTQSHYLSRHRRTHLNIKPFECSVCAKLFANKAQLQVHFRTHTGERPFPCQFCGQAFSHRNNLQSHVRTHTGERPFACTECDKSFAVKKILKQHMRTHTGEKKYACAECGRRFMWPHSLSSHTKRHLREKTFVCSCGVGFATKTHLNRHMASHPVSKPQPFACTVCGRRYRRNGNLLAHMSSHDGDSYECNECGKQFPLKKRLLRHMRIQHGGDVMLEIGVNV